MLWKMKKWRLVMVDTSCQPPPLSHEKFLFLCYRIHIPAEKIRVVKTGYIYFFSHIPHLLAAGGHELHVRAARPMFEHRRIFGMAGMATYRALRAVSLRYGVLEELY